MTKKRRYRNPDGATTLVLMALVGGVVWWLTKKQLTLVSSLTNLFVLPPDATVDVSCDDFMKGGSPARINRTIEVAAGQTIVVRLCSNASTGFSWEAARVSDQAVLQLLGHGVEAPTSILVGAAGREVWTLKARQSGTAEVSIDYSQPWTGGTKAVSQFTLGVTVR